MTGNPTLTIDRLNCRVRLAGGGINPGVVRDAIERAAGEELTAALAGLELPDQGDAVYRLRDLRLALWAAPGSEQDPALAARWAGAIGAALRRVLHSDDPARVVRFESPQAFTLHFLRDLIDGRAWNLWYYEEFAVLRLLPDARAALELLLSRPEWIVPLLRELMRGGHGARLLARWSAADLARLWAALGLRPAPATAAELAVVAPLWRSAPPLGGTDDDARARDTFRLWLAAPIQDAATLNAARLLVDVAALGQLVPEARGVLLMQTEFYPHLIARLTARGALEWVGALPDSVAGRAVLAAAAEIVAPRAAGAADDALALHSPVGGVFLLLAVLPRLGLWEEWLAAAGEDTARRYLFVLALKALGDQLQPSHFGDRLLAAFAGLDEPPPAEPGAGFGWLSPALDEMLSAATQRALRRFAALLPSGFADSSPAYLADRFLAHPAVLRRGQEEWQVRLEGGPLRMVLRMAPLPSQVRAPWLPLPVALLIDEESRP